jgi:opacity protein-like surface antigen
VYADGGWATGKVELNAVSGPPGAGVAANTERRHDGWTFGGGVSYMIDPHVVHGIDYEHVKLDGERHEALSTGAVVGLPFRFDSDDIELQTVTARLSIKLDRDAAPVPLK